MSRFERRGLVWLVVLCLILVASVGVAQPPYEANVTRGNPTGSGESSHDCNDPANAAANCGFETGDFSSWAPQDLAVPLFPLSVDIAGVDGGFGFFVSAPTEGTYAALHGFDGEGPGTIIVAQDITVPSGGGMEFDYRAAWDLESFGATMDRTFYVDVEPAGGGTAMQTDVILTATAGTTIFDTGPLSGIVDLSAFAGQTVRVSFEWDVPENFSGPAFFQLDNVLIAPGVPTMPRSALAALALALLLGTGSLFRRRARQS